MELKANYIGNGKILIYQAEGHGERFAQLTEAESKGLEINDKIIVEAVPLSNRVKFVRKLEEKKDEKKDAKKESPKPAAKK